MYYSNQTPVYAFNSPMTNSNSALSVGKMTSSKTKYITITAVTGVILVGLLATAVVVPITYNINNSASESTTTVTLVSVTTTTATTATTTTATTTTTTSTTSRTTSTTTSTSTSTTTSTSTSTTTSTSTSTTTSTSTSTTSSTSTSTTTSSSTSTTTSTSTATTTTTTTALPSRWNASGITVAGSSAGSSGVTTSLMSIVYSLALDSSNAVYITDYANNRIQKWTIGASSGTTVAGQSNGAAGASSTALKWPVGIVLDSSNNMYFTDRDNHRVMYWANGASSGTVIAGTTGVFGTTTNLLYNPSGLVRDSTNGTLYIADTSNHRIMCWLSGATSGTLVAGGNGAGTGSTQLSGPYSLAYDASSNSLIIVNYSAHTVVRWVLGATSWTLLAGTPGTSGTTSTLLNNPLSVVLDPYKNMYISDTSNHRIQFFLYGQSTGTTIAGTTASLGASATQLYLPYWAIVDSQLNLYVADTYNNRVQKFVRY